MEYISWLLEGEIKSEPIVALRAAAILAVTFDPGNVHLHLALLPGRFLFQDIWWNWLALHSLQNAQKRFAFLLC